VINAAEGGALFICGKVIDNTSGASCGDSAVEAMCVAVAGDSLRQLARQLTAASLNCIMTKGNKDCTGVTSVYEIFTRCNALCAGGETDQQLISDCIGELDDFNNGLLSDCHERPLCNKAEGLCFDPPGPANPDACQGAKKTTCGVIATDRGNCTGSAEACTPVPNPNCRSCENSMCSDETGVSRFPIISRIINWFRR
jgi:hypothetical protein